MKSISKRYASSAKGFADAHAHIEAAADSIRRHYKGGGNVMAEEAAKAICEHLKLLETCAGSMAQYVDNTYEEVYRQQEGHGRDIDSRGI